VQHFVRIEQRCVIIILAAVATGGQNDWEEPAFSSLLLFCFSALLLSATEITYSAFRKRAEKPDGDSLTVT
jgi:hypothetical protein